MNLCEEQINDWKIDIISNGQQMDGSVNSNPLENCRAFSKKPVEEKDKIQSMGGRIALD